MTGVLSAPPADAPAEGRVALVTGGSRGIGAAIAAELVAAGHRVVVTSRSGDVPDGLAGVWGLPCDVRSAADVDAVFDHVEAAWGPVGVAVSNAGIAVDGLLLRATDEALLDTLDVNLLGAARVARRALKGMIRARWGRLVFVSSVVGLAGSAGQSGYAASKSGLVGLARSLAREVGSRGITSNVVAPGFVDTDMTAGLGDARREAIVGSVPLGRTGTAAEIAAVVAFLASEPAGYVTGAVVPVDGGLGMGH